MSLKTNEVTLKQALQALMKAYRIDGKINERKVIDNWEKIIGKTIARHTRNIYVKDGKLFLTIDSAPLKHEISYSKNKIIEMVNSEVGVNLISEVILC